MPMAIVTPMLIGAAVGAVSAAITGGNILKGALFGALGGAIGGAVSMAFGAATSTAGAATGGMSMGGTEAVMPPNPDAGGMIGGEAVLPPMETVSPGFEAPPPSGIAVQPPGGGLAAPPDGGMAAPAPTSMADPTAAGSPGVANTNALDTRLARGLDGGTGLAAPAPGSGGGPTTYLDSLFESGKGMLNSRMGSTMIGEGLKGWAGGMNQQALIDQRQKEIEDARANARFGNTGSRYSMRGMIGGASTRYRTS
jgi:hypothetical protein